MRPPCRRPARARGALAAILTLALAGPAPAMEPADPPPDPVDFTLRFARVRTPLTPGEPSLVGNIGLAWRQQAARHWQAGVVGGYTAVTQTGRPLTAGMRLEGYHAGVTLRGLAWPRPSLQAFVEAGYVYYHANDAVTGQGATLEWQETTIAAGGIWHAPEALRLSARLDYGAVDGQERAYGSGPGATQHTLDFDTDKTGGAIGLEWRVDPSGDIGVQRAWGLHDGVLIYFQRRWP